MKVCIITDYLPDTHKNWSGAELVASKTGEILKSKGHDISYITLTPNKKCSRDNIYFVRSPFRKSSFLAKNFPIDLVAFLQVLTILRKIRPDVVHIQAKFLFFPSAAGSFLFRVPYVFTVLDYYNLCPRNILLRKDGKLCRYYHGEHCSDCVSQSNRKSVKLTNSLLPTIIKKLLFVLRKRLMDYFMAKASKIITFSETSKDRLLSYGYNSEKVEVIYHYVFENISRSKSCFSNTKDEILFVGTITYHKGLHILIEAMREVVKVIPGAKLLIAGSGSGVYRDSLVRKIEAGFLSNNIEFIGHKDNREILKLMNEVDLVVVPEQWDSEFGPVVLIEAKLAAKPVVASKIGSIPEYVHDGIDGILSEYNHPEDFAQAILNLLRDKDKSVMLGSHLSDRIKDISDSRESFSRLEKLYSFCEGGNCGL